eukprot:2605563-Pleurochrysis_carterae.AAC.1
MRTRDRGTRGDSHACGLRTDGYVRERRAGAGSGRPRAGRRMAARGWVGRWPRCPGAPRVS